LCNAFHREEFEKVLIRTEREMRRRNSSMNEGAFTFSQATALATFVVVDSDLGEK
jgi:hypothetical protein